MKIIRLDLLTMLISLFSFSACQKSNPNNVGLMVNPQDAINSIFTNAITVTSTTVTDSDPIQTSFLTKYPYGVLTDPLFGTTTSNLLMSLNLPSSNLTFGTSPVIDSAVLVLNYSNEYYGDPNAQFNFEVYQLSNRLISTSNLYNTNTDVPQSTIIGSKTCRIQINKQVLVTPIINGAAGTPANIAPHVRIRMDAFGATLLSTQPSSFVSNDTFDDFVKGLYLKALPATGSSIGGIVFFDLISGGSKLELYYHNAGSNTINYITFPIQTSGSNPSIAAFSHNFSGGGATEVQSKLNQAGTNYTFVQPMAGVRTQVNFPDLSPLTSQGNITINKAELVVSAQTLGSDNALVFTPAPRLYLYQTDIAGQRKYIPDCNGADPRGLSDIDFGGFYSTGDQKYRFIITSYIQDMVNKNSKQYNTYISVADSTASRPTALFSSATTARRVVIGGGTNGSQYQMKLNITYSKTN
ncbi:MAG: DUF4270 family protein [Pedobacter sp.]|nr:MAG: DUF4270 family protein [Pedobacter sp.]